MTVAKSVKSVSGKTVVFVNDERGRSTVSVFERNQPEPVLIVESIGQQESITLTHKLSLV